MRWLIVASICLISVVFSSVALACGPTEPACCSDYGGVRWLIKERPFMCCTEKSIDPLSPTYRDEVEANPQIVNNVDLICNPDDLNVDCKANGIDWDCELRSNTLVTIEVYSGGNRLEGAVVTATNTAETYSRVSDPTDSQGIAYLYLPQDDYHFLASKATYTDEAPGFWYNTRGKYTARIGLTMDPASYCQVEGQECSTGWDSDPYYCSFGINGDLPLGHCCRVGVGFEVMYWDEGTGRCVNKDFGPLLCNCPYDFASKQSVTLTIQNSLLIWRSAHSGLPQLSKFSYRRPYFYVYDQNADDKVFINDACIDQENKEACLINDKYGKDIKLWTEYKIV